MRSTTRKACAPSPFRRTSPRRPPRSGCPRPTSTSMATSSAAADGHRRARLAEQRRERAPRVRAFDDLVRDLGAVDTDRQLRADDLVALTFDLVHHDLAVHLEALGRRAVPRELAPEGHREAAGGCGREQLLGARLPFGVAD